MITKECEICKKEIRLKYAHSPKLKWVKRKRFCSIKCRSINCGRITAKMWKSKRVILKKPCLICKKIIKIQKSRTTQSIWENRTKYCSKKCLGKANALRNGNYSHSWKGGRTKSLGYILIKNRTHPFCNPNGYVFEHRLVMEKHIGRYLKPKEVVHHINHSRSDNKIENLMLFPDNASHKRYHKKLPTNPKIATNS